MPSGEDVRELVSVSEAARIKGRTKQTISERVQRLQDAGRLAIVMRGRTKLFSLAEFDDATGETSDPARMIAGDTARTIRAGDGRGGGLDEHVDGNLAGGKLPQDPGYVQELTRKARYDADRREIDVRRLKGELVEITDVRRAMERCAETIVRELEQLTAAADDLAAAVARNGSAGAREVIKAKVRDLRATLARTMTLLPAAEDDEDEGERSEA